MVIIDASRLPPMRYTARRRYRYALVRHERRPPRDDELAEEIRLACGVRMPVFKTYHGFPR